MKFKNPMLVVKDMDKSVEFYKEVFGFHVIMDFGANKTLTGGLSLQTEDKQVEIMKKRIAILIHVRFIYIEGCLLTVFHTPF